MIRPDRGLNAPARTDSHGPAPGQYRVADVDRTPITVAGQRAGMAHPLESLHPGGAGWTPVQALYIHVPFCFHKCHYCDFYSLVDTRDRQEPFADRLIVELARIAPSAGPLTSIFVGGGTPTLLRTDLWRRVLACLHEHYDLGHAEFTVECNPETATAELFEILAAGGVNRMSIGAQSFSPAHLKTLERWHDPANVERAIELARSAGIARQSVDLIFAIPGQTLAEWEADLDKAVMFGVEHLSCYALTYEPNTAMTARMRRGDFEPADEDLEADMLVLTLDTLRAHGYDRYEVSNYAKPGAECRHNLAYWRQDQWLAAGPSASGHVAGWRWKNAPRLDSYLGQPGGGVLPPAIDVEPPDPRRAMAERVMTGLRLREGIGASDLPEPLHALAQRLRDRGHLAVEGHRWRLTDAGMMLADGIAAEFMGLL
jgi:oxygen-independent coproporphyrinogen-3 oxidase